MVKKWNNQGSESPTAQVSNDMASCRLDGERPDSEAPKEENWPFCRILWPKMRNNECFNF